MTGNEARLEAILQRRRTVVVGVGNTLRGDDGAGVVVARALAARGLDALDAGTTPEDEVGHALALRPELVLFVDAAAHGGCPGDWCVATADELAPRMETTHAPSLALCGVLLAAHGVESAIVGIEPAATGAGSAMTPAVAAGARAVEAALVHALAAAGSPS